MILPSLNYEVHYQSSLVLTPGRAYLTRIIMQPLRSRVPGIGLLSSACGFVKELYIERLSDEQNIWMFTRRYTDHARSGVMPENDQNRMN